MIYPGNRIVSQKPSQSAFWASGSACVGPFESHGTSRGTSRGTSDAKGTGETLASGTGVSPRPRSLLNLCAESIGVPDPTVGEFAPQLPICPGVHV